MRIATIALRWVVRLAGLLQLVVGLAFWSGAVVQIVPLHILGGYLFTLAFLAIVVLAAFARVGLGPVLLGLVWVIVVPVIGVTQAMILNGPGDPHWIVRVVHLLVGVGAIGFADRLAGAIPARRAASVPGAPGVLPAMPPRWVFSFLNRIATFLLAAGVPLGFNGLITVRGRRSGLPRTTPVAIIEVSGRRWVWAPWGDVQWVRNLRAAGRATITVRRRKVEVRATELDPQERVGFFSDVLDPLARDIPFGVWFIRTVDGVDLGRPVEAAEGRPVFELHPLR
jgi:deazaflavin-dependent oxidoreductase (nitroreductase family)